MTGARLFPVHRIDRAASGVLLFAKTSVACAVLQEALSRPDATKE